MVEAEPPVRPAARQMSSREPQQKGARRAEPRLALRHLRLDHVVVAQGVPGAARDLVAGELDKRVEAPRAMPSATPANPAA